MVFDWFLNRFRPNPKFGKNQIAFAKTYSSEGRRYLLIERRRWEKENRRWVYEGPLFVIARNEMIYSGPCRGVGEEGLADIPGIECYSMRA